MSLLVINQREIRKLLPMRECVEVVRSALIELARGNAQQPLRSMMWLPRQNGSLGVMPASLESSQVFGIKVVSVFPGNENTELDAHQGLVLLMEEKNGQPMALLDATEITSIRTAAVSAVATDILSKKSSRVLAIIGSGVQAYRHIEAVSTVRDIEEVRIFSRTESHAKKLVERTQEEFKLPAKFTHSVREALSGADIVCTTTNSSKPIVLFSDLSPGIHINAVGACTPETREFDSDSVKHSRVFFDRRESALKEAGDLMIPLKEGSIDESHLLSEIGDILIGKAEGRKSNEEITLFKSLGLGVEDVAVAHYLYKKAKDQKVGVSISLGGKRA